MLEQFKGFIGYTEEEYKELWEKAIFVVDTNVLLNFYKYTSKESTTSLLAILKQLKDTGRLWIPHQVALEYFFNYESNMYKQHEGYKLLGTELRKLKEEAEKTLRTVQSEHPYIITDKFQFYINDIELSNTQLQDQLNNEIANLPDSKEIQMDLMQLLDGVIGEPYNQDKINTIEKDGLDRYKHNVPPGYKDKGEKKKENHRTYGDFRYQQLYGDLIVWHQMLDKASEEDNPAPIIFITEEKKEDWWEKEEGKIKRPQPQLIQEFFNKTKNNFYMYRTENFVKYAKEYLDAGVTDEQVENVTKDVEQIRKSEEKEEKEKKKLSTHYKFRERDNYFKNNNEIKNNLIEIKNNLNVEKLLDYLTEEQKVIFKENMGNAFDVNMSPETSNHQYNQAINWALSVSVSALEKKVRELTAYIALKDYNKAQKANERFATLSDNDNPVKRALMLIEQIEKLQKDIDFIEYFGF
ncbi:PIN-like domain-containing protein [Rossellomorea marisflavi]|uniref:PIN-like domain-containing protein n=1 Tax=Rossellomorea marisflavi TaxID=189381 RepID=UPI003D2EBE9C